MKCLLFAGITVFGTVDAYNNWAKDKALHKDVIIHTHYLPRTTNSQESMLIVVFFDENLHPSWVGKTE